MCNNKLWWKVFHTYPSILYIIFVRFHVFSKEGPQSTDTTEIYRPYKNCFLVDIPGLCTIVADLTIHLYYNCLSEGLCITGLVTDHSACSQTLISGHYTDFGDTSTLPKDWCIFIQFINCSQNPLAILSYGLSATEKRDSWIYECNNFNRFYHT